MTDAPERIWAWASGLQPAEGAFGLWSESDKWKQQRGIEYIRADLVPAMLAAERVAVIEAALQELGYAAWRHEGDDSYSIGLEAGARRQSQADFDAIRALSDDAVTAARAAIEDEGYRRGLEAAAKIAEGRAGNNLADAPPVIAFDRGYVDGCTSAAAAIRALIGGRR